MSGLAERYATAFVGIARPFAFVDLDAFDANGARLASRAGGKPIRVASKSIRSRALVERALAMDAFAGTLNLTLPEALWLGVDDAVVGYPWVGREAIAAIPEDGPVLMVDCAEQLDVIVAAARVPVRVCLDLDVGFWPLGGRLKFGPKRSPIRTPEAARALAAEVARRDGVELVGVMAYEGQIAGVADAVPGRALENLAIRVMKSRSAADVASRRAAMVAAVREVADLRFVNGGGTGSVAETAAEDAVTEVAAGSGFYAPMLFQYYRSLGLAPAAGFALDVVRKPSASTATLLGGGYVASGAVRKDRLPVPVLPAGLRLDPLEGAGEAQTPVLGPGAAALSVGDTVYLRHAKAGELCERFDTLVLLSGDAVVDVVPTYRGEGRTFL